MGKSDKKMVLKRLVWLLDTIYKAGDEGITKQEIVEKWRRKVEFEKYGNPEYPKRTFRNHIQNIKDLFDVEIECNNWKYSVAYRNGIDIDALTAWMINSISVKNTVVENAQLRERILFEPIHAGWKFLQPVLDAMEASVMVKINYKRFGDEKSYEYTVQPYFLKLFKRRWYLVGYYSDKGKVYTFSLDRIEGISLTKEVFKLPEIKESDFFGNCFGIIREKNSTPQRVEIKVFGEQIEYIRSVPLHESQNELMNRTINGVECSLFEYRLHITYDFVQELLSHGKSLQVIEPDSLKKKMKEHILAMLNYYR